MHSLGEPIGPFVLLLGGKWSFFSSKLKSSTKLNQLERRNDLEAMVWDFWLCKSRTKKFYEAMRGLVTGNTFAQTILSMTERGNKVKNSANPPTTICSIDATDFKWTELKPHFNRIKWACTSLFKSKLCLLKRLRFLNFPLSTTLSFRNLILFLNKFKKLNEKMMPYFYLHEP